MDRSQSSSVCSTTWKIRCMYHLSFFSARQDNIKLTDLYAMAMKSKPHERMGIVKASLDLIAWHREVLAGLISGLTRISRPKQ